jgi:pimeloyl-ACP methyl ester carboxylesterase
VVDYGGGGPDLLLLHGAGRTLGDWGLVLPYLVRERRVVAMDFRWHGLSGDDGDAGLEANADDVEAVISELGLQNPVVAGHSLGGMTAAVYGGRHPECPGVVNLDGHGRGTREEFEEVSDEHYETYLTRMKELSDSQAAVVRSGDDSWRDGVIAGWQAIVSGFGWSFPAEVAQAADARSFRRDGDGAWHLRPHATYAESLTAALASVRMFDIYRRCECPLLIYHCSRLLPMPDAQSTEVGDARQRGLARHLQALALDKPNIRVKTLDATHMVVFDVPEQVAEDILSIAS